MEHLQGIGPAGPLHDPYAAMPRPLSRPARCLHAHARCRDLCGVRRSATFRRSRPAWRHSHEHHGSGPLQPDFCPARSHVLALRPRRRLGGVTRPVEPGPRGCGRTADNSSAAGPVLRRSALEQSRRRTCAWAAANHASERPRDSGLFARTAAQASIPVTSVVGVSTAPGMNPCSRRSDQRSWGIGCRKSAAFSSTSARVAAPTSTVATAWCISGN